MTPRESDIQRAIIAQVNVLPGAILYRINVVVARAGRRTVSSVINPRTGKVFRGHSDLIGCANGRFLAIETKSADGEQSDDQRMFQDWVESTRGIYLIARDVAATVARVRELLR